MKLNSLKIGLLATCIASLAKPAHAERKGDKWNAPPYANGSLAINVRSAVLTSGKIWLETLFINNSDGVMTVDPDQLQAKLPDGQIVYRARGVFDKVSHNQVAIAPHASHLVNFEFPVKAPDKISVVVAGLTLNGSPVSFPDLVLKPSGRGFVAADYHYSGLRILVTSAKPQKENLALKITVFNETDNWVGFDRDKTQAKLPNGAMVAREHSVFDKKFLITLPPRQSSEIELEYKVGHPTQLSVLPAAFANGTQLPLPELILQQP